MRKEVITIAEVRFSKEFETESKFKMQMVNLNIVERLEQFEKDEDDEKVLVNKRQLGVRMSDFKRILVLNEWLALIPEEDLNEDQSKFEKDKQSEIIFAKHVRCLKAAKLTIEREEVFAPVYDTKKPLHDKDGNVVVDEDGNVQYEVKKDENGKDMKQLVGFGEMSFVDLKLTGAAEELAKHHAFA